MVTEVKVGSRLQIPPVAMTVPRVGILHEVSRPRMARGCGCSHPAWARGLGLAVSASAPGSPLGPAVKFQGPWARGLRLEAWAHSLSLGLGLTIWSNGYIQRPRPAVKSRGEEPPESLFMKELKKRGMTPISLLEESNRSIFWDDEMKFKEEERGYSKRNAVTTDYEKGLYAESEPSTALNSGLKSQHRNMYPVILLKQVLPERGYEELPCIVCAPFGLDSPIWTFAIPWRNVLLDILAVDLHNSGILLCSILSCDLMGISHDRGSYEVCNLEVLSRRNCGPEVRFFDLDVEYCGSAFVHDGSAITLPQYVDPYALLEDEMISQTASLVN
ncbi:hypothetical protein RHGRI_013847 [Rhododendron griersonianum]|uniref:Uncharacterized protein n=1 Tax=Rhododendron griersonianum TaxID=479676 RepID=A0AAV6K7L5_9ERIC|nr:hypothetical protein RHGRI_013847 [Rhododendron griersonianum]